MKSLENVTKIADDSVDLDIPLEELREHLYDAADMVIRLYSDLEKKKVFLGESPAEVKALFDESLPRSGTDINHLLRRVEREVVTNSTLGISPHFYAYVQSGGNHVGILAELISAALNQNTGKWHLGSAAAELELRVVRWVAEFIGFPSDTSGVLVSGGSAASLTCLKAARDSQASFDVRKQGVRSGAPLTLYVSTEGHSCLDKASDMLGIGTNHLRRIPVRDDFTIDLDLLEQRIMQDKEAGNVPFCVIGNGGTVNTGAIDPLNDLADICERHGLWFHVDAAYGGPAAATLLAHDLFKGIERAHSVATDAHKWFYVPFEAGVAFVRSSETLRNSFSVLPDYLRSDTDHIGRHDSTEYNFQLSRNFKALKIWMTFKAYGSDRLRRSIENNIEAVHHLAEQIDASADFERLAPAPLSIVCFRYRTDDLRFHGDDEYLSLLNRRILAEIERDGRVFLTGTILNGRNVLRACSVNHRTQTEHTGFLLKVLREIGSRVHRELQNAKKQYRCVNWGSLTHLRKTLNHEQNGDSNEATIQLHNKP